MTTIVRWNPVRDMLRMRYDVDRLFDEFGGRTAPDRVEESSWRLALDIVEKEHAFVVKASVPGVNPEDMDITINENTLTIQGQVQLDETFEEGQYHVRERRHGSFSRSLILPKTVSRKDIEADYENGVLTLLLPKAAEVQPQRITVKTNGHGKEVIEAETA